jgi:hypothetical protein
MAETGLQRLARLKSGGRAVLAFVLCIPILFISLIWTAAVGGVGAAPSRWVDVAEVAAAALAGLVAAVVGILALVAAVRTRRLSTALAGLLAVLVGGLVVFLNIGVLVATRAASLDGSN